MNLSERLQASFDRLPDSSGIHLREIVPPETGWPIMAHCPLCKRTDIVLVPWGSKPGDGDILLMRRTCLDPELGTRHQLDMDRASAGPFGG